MSDSGPPNGKQKGGPDQSILTRFSRLLLPGIVRRNYVLKFALALLVVVLLIASIGVVSYIQIQGIIEDDAENTLRSTATVQSGIINEWINGMESQTRGIASSDIYGTQDREQIRSHLRDSQALAGSDIRSAHYVNPQSDEIVASTDPDYEGRLLATTVPAWGEVIERATDESDEQGAVVSSSRVYERNGHLLIAFAHPARVGDGVVVIVADVRQSFELLHDSETITTTRVLDTNGSVVDAPRQSQPISLTDTAAFEDARNGETAVYEQESTVFAFSYIESTGWIVVAEAPKTQLYQASETVGRNVAFLVAFSLISLTIVGVVIGRGTVLPLLQLRERIRAVEVGEFDGNLQTNREDEIGQLFASFARMQDSLRTQICETEAARERAERSRRQLARQNERLDQFASTVSHDLRNPLNVADGHRELLATKLTESEDIDPGVLQEHVKAIDDSHARMETIIDDVLVLAREGKTIDETTRVDLESVASDAWDHIDHKDATLTVVETRSFEADRDRLLRVFENLFRNSIEHGSTNRSDLHIEAENNDAALKSRSAVSVEVGPTENGFYIADDGPGIPSEAVDNIFEYGHTTAEDGTGFGLAIVETIVSAHNWTITVDKNYDTGAKFVISTTDEE